MSQKGLTPLFIIILIALVIGGYLVYQKQIQPVSTPQQTQSTPAPIPQNESSSSATSDNWKVYQDEGNQFSIKYPSDKKIEIRKEDTTKHSCHGKSAVVDILVYPSGYIRSQNEIDFTGELWMDISVVDNKNLLFPEDFLIKNCPQLYESKIASKKSIQIDNTSGLKIEYKDVMVEQMEVILKKDKKLYFIHGFSSKLPNSIFDLMVATFRFLDQTTTDICTDKTYRSLEEALEEPNKVCYLDLSDRNLTELPKEVLQFSSLKSLYLNNNKLTSLPSDIVKLKNLQSIDLTGNPENKNLRDDITKINKINPKIKILFLRPMNLP